MKDLIKGEKVKSSENLEVQTETKNLKVKTEKLVKKDERKGLRLQKRLMALSRQSHQHSAAQRRTAQRQALTQSR